MWKRFKKKLERYMLKREAAWLKRNKQAANFKEAKNIGLLFDATQPDNLELVKKYIKYLRDCKKTVRSLGFYNKKEIPPLQSSSLNYDFLSKKQLNLYGKPTGISIHNFINEEFDILINLSLKECIPLMYITALSKAKFKIGKYDETYKIYYDMLLNIEEDKNLKYLMRHIDHYLNIINIPNTETH